MKTNFEKVIDFNKCFSHKVSNTHYTDIFTNEPNLVDLRLKLIKEEIEESVNKVPILGDIPLLGRIFRSSAESIDKRNLMVFLRPTILRDAVTTKDLSEEKFNLIRARQILESDFILEQQD